MPETRLEQVYDLHCHSTASDGKYSPTQLVHAAVDAGVTVLALTDHDTTAGLAEAQQAAATTDLRLIAGVEISATWAKRTLHIVGLNFDPAHEQLRAGLKHHNNLRELRAAQMAAKLEKAGVQNALSRAQAMAGGEVTRTHLARLLVDDGICKDMNHAFKRFLGDGKPAYVRTEWAALKDVIDWIHVAGGQAVLAHPFRYDMTGAWRQRMLESFKASGGDAVEICSGSSHASQHEQAARYAQRWGLRGSVGSDFHDPAWAWNKLGRVGRMPKSVAPVWEAWH